VQTSDSNVILGGQPEWDTPSFSPDGKYVAFSDLYASPQQLSVMTFDGGTGFSNSRVVTVDTTTFVTWPSFLPDSLGVVFHRGNNYLTGNKASGVNVDLHMVEVNSASEGTVSTLGLLNGYLPDGTFYLPYGEAQEGHMNFQPSVLPRPIGGYYWVMFPTRRAYGNTIAPGGTDGGSMSSAPERKKCWVSAIDVTHQGEADPSHPAFYLDGQAFPADTNRPFVALEPCHPDGAPCESGADCCSGFCRETSRAADGTPILQCVPPPPGACANVDEACVTVADCCDPTNLCIAGRCAIPTQPIY
jgi:hypothetical protein